MIIYMADKLKKTYGKNSNALGNMKAKNSRTAKMYTVNIEKENLKAKKRTNITKCKRQKIGKGIFPYSFTS